MTKLEQIEKAIAALPHDDIVALADWFAEFHADLWDKQIEADAKSGKLDKFAAEALADVHKRRPQPSPCEAFHQPGFLEAFQLAATGNTKAGA